MNGRHTVHLGEHSFKCFPSSWPCWRRPRQSESDGSSVVLCSATWPTTVGDDAAGVRSGPTLSVNEASSAWRPDADPNRPAAHEPCLIVPIARRVCLSSFTRRFTGFSWPGPRVKERGMEKERERGKERTWGGAGAQAVKGPNRGRGGSGWGKGSRRQCCMISLQWSRREFFLRLPAVSQGLFPASPIGM